MKLNLEQYGNVFSEDEKQILEELYSKLISLSDKLEHCNDDICEQDPTPEST